MLSYNALDKGGTELFRQIVNADTCQYLSCEELWAQFGKRINITDLYKVVNAIPKDWLRIVKHKINMPMARWAQNGL